MRKCSLDAYEQLVASGKQNTLRAQVYRYIQKHTGVTQPEISKELGESARKRISELLASGLVEEFSTIQIGRLSYTQYATAETIERLLPF